MMARNPPLLGVKVIEFAGLAPGPFAGMVLADFGADVIRIDRPGTEPSADVLARGKKSLAISLKSSAGREIVAKLLATADVVIDPYRPGVLEKLDLGPEVCFKLNTRLIYAQLSGYPRTGPYAQAAGHDINYLAMSGVLAMMRPAGGAPYPPLNLLADFAGGGMICVQGILLALLARATTGTGQVVEADMVSGTRYISSFPLLSVLPEMRSSYWTGQKAGSNLLDGGAPFYAIYQTKDAKFVSVGALETKFYAELLQILRADPQVASASVTSATAYPAADQQYTQSTWDSQRAYFRFAFRQRTRNEWSEIFKGSDACVAPVLEPHEAMAGEHGNGIPSPAPHLQTTPAMQSSRTPSECRLLPGSDSKAILEGLGYTSEVIKALEAKNIVTCHQPSLQAKL